MAALQSLLVAVACLTAVGCDRPDSQVRATAEAAARSARAARYDLDDRTFAGQPGGPSEAAAPSAPPSIDSLLADIIAEVDAIVDQVRASATR